MLQLARHAGLGIVLGLGFCLAGSRPMSAADASPARAAAPRPAWSSLRFEATSWLADVRVEFELRTEPPDAARGGSAEGWLSVFRTRMDSRVLARKTSETETRFDPGTGSVTGYTKLVLGPTPNRKTYQFSREGAARTRIDPRPGEARDRPETWSMVRKTFHPFETRALGCQLLSEPAVLVYEISSGALLASSHADGFCMFSGKTLFRLQIADLGSRTLDVDYEIDSRASTQRRNGRLEAECYRILGQPIAGENDEDDVHLEFCVDPRAQLPVQLSTGTGVLGNLSVRLVRVVGR